MAGASGNYGRRRSVDSRKFKACDVARIAREAVKDQEGATPEIVLACVAKGFGINAILVEKESGQGTPPSGVKTSGLSIEQINTGGFKTSFVPVAAAAGPIAARVALFGAVKALKVLSKTADRLKLVKVGAAIKGVIEALDRISDIIDELFDGKKDPSDNDEPADKDGKEYERKNVDDVLNDLCNCKKRK